jgi:hypothetical protein
VIRPLVTLSKDLDTDTRDDRSKYGNQRHRGGEETHTRARCVPVLMASEPTRQLVTLNRWTDLAWGNRR